MLLNRFFPF